MRAQLQNLLEGGNQQDHQSIGAITGSLLPNIIEASVMQNRIGDEFLVEQCKICT